MAASVHTMAQDAVHDALHCEVISTPEALHALREEWNELAGASGRVFLSHEWFAAAWEWAGEQARLHVVCARRAGRLAGIAPLCRRRRALWGLPLATIEFIVVPDTPYCDVIVAPANAAAFAQALVDHLHALPRWHMIELVKLCPESATPALLGRALQERGRASEACVPLTEHGVDLRTSWQAYYATRSRRLKKGNNLVANQLRRNNERVEIESWQHADARLADILTRVSAGSWKSTTGTSFDVAGPKRFLARLLQLASGRGCLRVFALTLNGEPAATELQILDGRTVYALRADFDRRFEKQSPGTYLNWKILEGSFDGTRDRYSMGTGANPYKLRWANQTRALTGLRYYSRAPRAMLVRLLEHRLRPLVRRLRERGARTSAAQADADG